MKTKTEMQIAKEIEVARLFEVEELEERLEFSSWTASLSGDSNGVVTGTVGVTF